MLGMHWFGLVPAQTVGCVWWWSPGGWVRVQWGLRLCAHILPWMLSLLSKWPLFPLQHHVLMLLLLLLLIPSIWGRGRGGASLPPGFCAQTPSARHALPVQLTIMCAAMHPPPHPHGAPTPTGGAVPAMVAHRAATGVPVHQALIRVSGAAGEAGCVSVAPGMVHIGQPVADIE